MILTQKLHVATHSSWAFTCLLSTRVFGIGSSPCLCVISAQAWRLYTSTRLFCSVPLVIQFQNEKDTANIREAITRYGIK